MSGSALPISGSGQPSVHLRVEGLTKSFDGSTVVLDGVDLDVSQGATVALLGPSGCGKTTLLRMIAGLESPDAGVVELGGQTLSGDGVFVAPEARRIGMVFQDWALFPHLTVGRNVGFGLPRRERNESPRILELLDLVSLGGLENRPPALLSGGQQQRVALARALAPRPEMLLLDEPFSNLDASLRGQVRGEVHRLLSDLGVTTVFVTHDQDEAFVMGDAVAVMNEGRIVQVGTPEQIYQHPASRWVAGFVGDANFVAGDADGRVAETVLGRLSLSADLSGTVEVLVRPEALSISAAASHTGPGCEGVVSLVEYLGHSTRYVVDCAGVDFMVRSGSDPILRRGDRARIECRESSPLVAFQASPSGS